MYYYVTESILLGWPKNVESFSSDKEQGHVAYQALTQTPFGAQPGGGIFVLRLLHNVDA